MYVQKRYNKNSIKIKNSQFVLIISCLVFLSFPPWFVWSLGEWNMRIISLITLIIALKLLSYSKIKQNILLASLYLISALYMNFGGLNGYTLPNHLEFTVFILLLSLSKNFLLNVLEKFEKIVTVVFILGIITYLIGLIIELPSFLYLH
jgi:membrane-associated HD superfamily phosphohydrolase